MDKLMEHSWPDIVVLNKKSWEYAMINIAMPFWYKGAMGYGMKFVDGIVEVCRLFQSLLGQDCKQRLWKVRRTTWLYIELFSSAESLFTRHSKNSEEDAEHLRSRDVTCYPV